MLTVPDIIKRLGGPTKVAGLLGLPAATTVASWKTRNSIPVEHWPKLLDAASSENIDLDYGRLVEAHARKDTAA